MRVEANTLGELEDGLTKVAKPWTKLHPDDQELSRSNFYGKLLARVAPVGYLKVEINPMENESSEPVPPTRIFNGTMETIKAMVEETLARYGYQRPYTKEWKQLAPTDPTLSIIANSSLAGTYVLARITPIDHPEEHSVENPNIRVNISATPPEGEVPYGEQIVTGTMEEVKAMVDETLARYGYQLLDR